MLIVLFVAVLVIFDSAVEMINCGSFARPGDQNTNTLLLHLAQDKLVARARSRQVRNPAELLLWCEIPA